MRGKLALGRGSFLALLLGVAFALFGFAPAAEAVTVKINLAGGGQGTVKSLTPGIECSNVPDGPDVCEAEFVAILGGLRLEATAGPDSGFIGWSGDPGGTCTGANPACETSILFLGNKELTATFGPLPEKPSVVTQGASDLRFPTAQFAGRVNPNSDAFALTDCYFEFGPTEDYGQRADCDVRPATGTTPVSVTATAGPLISGTVYHYRLVAANAAGGKAGNDRTFTSATAPPDSCPNAEVRAQQGPAVQALPNCLAFEQVSPENTSGQSAVMAYLSPDGKRALLTSAGGWGDVENLPDLGTRYAADYGELGWTSYPLAPPASLYPRIRPYATDTSPDGRETLWEVNLKEDGYSEYWTPVVRNAQGDFEVVAFTRGPEGGVSNPGLVGTSADLRTVVTSTSNRPPLDDGTVDTRPTSQLSLYVSRRGEDGSVKTSQLLYRDGAMMFPANCGGILGGRVAGQGAVSDDGNRIFFTSGGNPPCITGEHRRVWVKDGDDDPVDISASQCTVDCGAVAAVDFAAAAVDGSRVYFTTTEKLLDSDQGTTSPADLYEYDFEEDDGTLRPVTSSSASQGAGVLGVVQVSLNGEYVYFVANGRPLAGTNARGEAPQSGNNNLYVFRRAKGQATGSFTFIGRLDSADSGQWGSSNNSQTSSDGRFLLLTSASNLTGEKQPGDSFTDVYRYDSKNDELRRLWPDDPEHNGSNRIAGVQIGGGNRSASPNQGGAFQQRRYGNSHISADGRTVGFTTSEPLSPWDYNKVPDAYIWTMATGEFQMLTGGLHDAPTGSNSGSAGGFSAVSEFGEAVAFGSYAPVLKSHTSGQRAAFVARSGGGFLEEAAPVGCQGDACQGPNQKAPGTADLASVDFDGSGNATPPASQAAPARVAKRAAVRGNRAVLRVRVAEPGTLSIQGRQIRRATRSAAKSGVYRIVVKVKPAVKRRLAKRAQVRVPVRVVFRPREGAKATQKVTLVLRKAPGKAGSSARGSSGR